jgi:hypothetical protein
MQVCSIQTLAQFCGLPLLDTLTAAVPVYGGGIESWLYFKNCGVVNSLTNLTDKGTVPCCSTGTN